MELNEIETFAIKTSRMIRSYFGKRMDGSSIYDIVEKNNYRTFKINFIAYNYVCVEFDYENDWCEFFIVLNEACKQSLYGKTKFSEITDWDAYLTGIMKDIELRIPDKFLKAKGWL